MSTTTTNYGLIKPELTDPANITATNPNWDKIDDELNGLAMELDSAGIKMINATSSNGVEYFGTVESITELTVGLTLMFIPNTTSTNTTPTFNLNNLGTKNIRRKLSIGTASTVAGNVASWFYANRPSLLVYDGTQWIAEDFTKPCATDLYGTVAVGNGGTGATDVQTARTNLDVYSKAEVAEYVRTQIAAIADYDKEAF